jgi:hypothetical protein
LENKIIMMGHKLDEAEIVLGILLILVFTAFIAYLTFQQPATTTTLMTTTSAAFLPSSTTSLTTTTSRTTTSAASTSSSNPAATTTTTMLAIECAADIDCGKEHYEGTYICRTEGPTTALQNCTPKCVHGACTEKCDKFQSFDRCNRTQVCIPGWRRCVDRDRFKNVSAKVEVFPDKYTTYRGYQFRLNYTAYLNAYEVRLLLIDVIAPGGGRDQTIATWDMPTTLDDMEVGIYGVKRYSAIIWLQKIVNETE